MLQAIIDIGSNSIRLVIYKIEDFQDIKILMNKKELAGLASYIKNGVMTDDGIDKACQVLNEFKHLLDNFNVTNIAAFATAALRNIKNSDNAIKQIEEKTNLTIQLLSGTEEATLGFIGATKEVDNNNGLLLDIGGASTEIVICKNSIIEHAISLPIGSLNAAKLFVENILPTKDERKIIKDTVLVELSKYKELSSKKFETICGIGGTIRATCKINKYLFNLPIDNTNIKTPNIKKMIKLLENDSTDNSISCDSLQILLKTVPDRIETVLSGMIILHTLTKHFKADNLILSTSGVREGYLYNYIIGPTEKESVNDNNSVEVDNNEERSNG